MMDDCETPVSWPLAYAQENGAHDAKTLPQPLLVRAKPKHGAACKAPAARSCFETLVVLDVISG